MIFLKKHTLSLSSTIGIFKQFRIIKSKLAKCILLNFYAQRQKTQKIILEIDGTIPYYPKTGMIVFVIFQIYVSVLQQSNINMPIKRKVFCDHWNEKHIIHNSKVREAYDATHQQKWSGLKLNCEIPVLHILGG